MNHLRSRLLSSGATPLAKLTVACTALALTACSGGSSSSSTSGALNARDVAPQIGMIEPAAPLEIARGGLVPVSLTATDPDDVATIRVWADIDGDPATTIDRHLIAGPLSEQDGAQLDVVADTSGIEAGTFFVVGEIRSSKKLRSSVAPGTFTTADRSWAKAAGGTGGEANRAVAADLDESMIVAGSFVQDVTFGFGEPNAKTLTAVASEDAFLARYAPDGSLDWAEHAFSNGRAVARTVSVRPDGSIMVSGFFQGEPVTFGFGGINQTTLENSGDSDVFLAKYMADGSLQWARQAGGDGDDRGLALQALEDGTTLVAGRFAGDATFGGGFLGEVTLTSLGEGDLFLARYQSNGTLDWVQQAGNLAGKPTPHDVKALESGAILVAGTFTGDVTFGGGLPNEITLTSGGLRDGFVAYYEADGSFGWARSFGGSTENLALGVSAFADGSFVVGGSFAGTNVFGAGEPNETTLIADGDVDAYLARFDAQGFLTWAVRAGGIAADLGQQVCALADGSVLLGGSFADTAVFGLGEPAETSLVSNGETDAFLARYADDGSLLWVDQAGGVGADEALDATGLPDGSAVIAGFFSSNATFGLGDPNATSLNATDAQDCFLARFNPDGDF